MVDYFALFQEPRRPWISLDLLKAKFLAFSAGSHPDRVHIATEQEKLAANERYADINAAYNCLREPRDRLLHLLEIELGTKPKDTERLPALAGDLFFHIGQTCREVDMFLNGKSRATSPMLKVQWFQTALEWIDKMNELKQSIHSHHEQVLDELKAMNASWDAAPQVGSAERRAALPLERLEQTYRRLSYLSRWNEQIQARTVQLSV